MGRAINGNDLIELAASGTARNRTLRHIASYLHELGPDDRARVLGKVAEMLRKCSRLNQSFIDWMNETKGP